MEKVMVKSLSEKGREVLVALKAKIDIPMKDRFLYRQMFTERVLSEEPFTFEIRPSKKFDKVAGMVRVADFMKELEIEMEHRGAERGLDYQMEGS